MLKALHKEKVREGIDFVETFSRVAKFTSIRIISALTAYYDLELHQMDVKTASLNGLLEEEIYMIQPEGFGEKGNENKVCKLNKSIYGLKQASRQWYFFFDNAITSYGFSMTEVLVICPRGNHRDDCIASMFMSYRINIIMFLG